MLRLAQELCGGGFNPELGELLKELGERLSTFWRSVTSALSRQLGCGGEEGDLRRFAWISGALAFDYGKATACRQFGFKWFEGVDLYRSLVEAPVRGVGFLCVGKRGGACSAVRLAALNAWRFSFLSWKK